MSFWTGVKLAILKRPPIDIESMFLILFLEEYFSPTLQYF